VKDNQKEYTIPDSHLPHLFWLMSIIVN